MKALGKQQKYVKKKAMKAVSMKRVLKTEGKNDDDDVKIYKQHQLLEYVQNMKTKMSHFKSRLIEP